VAVRRELEVQMRRERQAEGLEGMLWMIRCREMEDEANAVTAGRGAREECVIRWQKGRMLTYHITRKKKAEGSQRAKDIRRKWQLQCELISASRKQRAQRLD